MAKSTEGWVQMWERGHIPFHRPDVHSALEKYLPQLTNPNGPIKIFIPLCGKTLDMKWLYDLGHTVVGVELASKAIIEFFQEHNLEFVTEKENKFTVYKTADGRIKLYCGDIFEFTRDVDGLFDGIWDRGAYVALEVNLRERYSNCMIDLLNKDGQYLLETMNYDTAIMTGPPHSVTEEAISQCYGERCNIKLLERKDALEGGGENWKKIGHKYFYLNYHLLCQSGNKVPKL